MIMGDPRCVVKFNAGIFLEASAFTPSAAKRAKSENRVASKTETLVVRKLRRRSQRSTKINGNRDNRNRYQQVGENSNFESRILNAYLVSKNAF